VPRSYHIAAATVAVTATGAKNWGQTDEQLHDGRRLRDDELVVSGNVARFEVRSSSWMLISSSP
jgi:hypothetical protein